MRRCAALRRRGDARALGRALFRNADAIRRTRAIARRRRSRLVPRQMPTKSRLARVRDGAIARFLRRDEKRAFRNKSSADVNSRENRSYDQRRHSE
jgi:hypothetical protein